MIKIISKKKYERLCRENDKLHKEVAFLRKEKESEINHDCNKIFCNDCVHVIEPPRSYDCIAPVYCELDRHCNDYVKKGAEKN